MKLAMILINKNTKLSSHMASMSINDRPLVKQIMLIGLSSAQLLLNGVNEVHFFQKTLSAGTKTN